MPIRNIRESRRGCCMGCGRSGKGRMRGYFGSHWQAPENAEVTPVPTKKALEEQVVYLDSLLTKAKVNLESLKAERRTK